MRKPSRPSRTRRIFASFMRLLLLGGVGLGGYFAYPRVMDWLARREESSTDQAPVAAFTPLPIQRSGTVPVQDALGLGALGVAERLRNADGTAVIRITLSGVSTPDPLGSFSYDVWMLKEGLADVVRVGALSPRADGTWFLSFSLSGQTGFLNADAYAHLVITQEPNDGDPLPSRTVIGRAQW